MMRLTVIALIGLILVQSGTVGGEAIYFDSGDAPFMVDDDNRAAGLYPALVAEAFRRMHVDVSLTPIPWRRALMEVDSTGNGVGGIYKNSDRLQKYDFSDKLFDEVIVLYVRKGERFAYRGLDSLRGRKIGVLRGWSYGDAFDEAVRQHRTVIEDVPSDRQNFDKLANGRLDVVLAVKQAAELVLSTHPQAGIIEALGKPFSIKPVFLAYAKTSHKTAILADFNQALAGMRQDGSFDRIVTESLGAITRPEGSRP